MSEGKVVKDRGRDIGVRRKRAKEESEIDKWIDR